MKTLMTLMTCLFLSVACLDSGDSENSSSSNGFTGSTGGGGTTSTTQPSGTNATTTTLPGSLPGSGSTTGSSTANCYDPGVGDQILDYYKLPVQGVGDRASTPTWSSRYDIGESNASEGIMVTDSRLHLRVIARPAPGVGGECGQQAPYNKLSMSISIKGRNSGNYLQTLVFNEVAVDECSQVLRYTTIPNNSPSEPFIMEIHDVKSDFTCTYFPNSVGCPGMILAPGDSSGPALDSCWKIELQMATDSTRDMPR